MSTSQNTSVQKTVNNNQVQEQVDILLNTIEQSKSEVEHLRSRYDSGSITLTEYGKGMNKEVKRIEDKRKQLTKILDDWSKQIKAYVDESMQDVVSEIANIKIALAEEGKGSDLIDKVEIVDINKVPPHLIDYVIKRDVLKSYLTHKNVKQLEGLNITYKKSVRL